jgi:hypothetical protein
MGSAAQLPALRATPVNYSPEYIITKAFEPVPPAIITPGSVHRRVEFNVEQLGSRQFL